MYKSDYYTKEQMTKYKMQANIRKTWLHTLQFFTKHFAQRKAYGDDRVANRDFDSAAHINNIPTDCSLVSTSSYFTTRNLYNESLEESLATAKECVAKEHTLSWTNWTQRTYYTRNLTPNANSLTSS
jgi:hypothetical protein